MWETVNSSNRRTWQHIRSFRGLAHSWGISHKQLLAGAVCTSPGPVFKASYFSYFLIFLVIIVSKRFTNLNVLSTQGIIIPLVYHYCFDILKIYIFIMKVCVCVCPRHMCQGSQRLEDIIGFPGARGVIDDLSSPMEVLGAKTGP